MHKLSIVIVNYRVPYLIDQALKAVKKASEDLDVELWVVDNNSGDDSIAYLKERYPEVNYIENKENYGFSKANNQAIKASNSEFVLMLNPDTIIAEDTLKVCLEHFKHNENCGALGVKMHNIHGEYLKESKRGFPSLSRSLWKFSGLVKAFPKSKTFAGYYFGHLSENEVQKIEVLSGAFMMMRHKALDQIGRLDERFFMYGEDIDLSYRFILAGWECHYLPIPIIHYKGESSSFNKEKYKKDFYGAMVLFFDKYYGARKSKYSSAIVKFAINVISLFSRGNTKGDAKLKRAKAMQNRPLQEVTLPLDEANMPASGTNLCIKAEDYSYSEIIRSVIKHRDQAYTYHFRYSDGLLVSPKQ